MRTIQNKTEIKTHEPANTLSEELNTIKNRFYLLEKRDRTIISLYIDKGLSFRQIALLYDTSPSSISRRIKKIAFKLKEGNFVSCMKKKRIFTHSEMTIAREYFVGGLSLKQIAERKNTSFYHIREIVNEIRQTINKTPKEK